MTRVLSVLETVLPVFLALGLGMLCRGKGFLKREGIDALKWVVLNLTLPFVLLNAFATAEYTLQTLALPAVMFALCCLALVIGKCLCKAFRVPGRLAPFLATGFEAGMLGYALFALLFPQVSISRFAMLDLGQTLFVFTLYKILLSGKKDLGAVGKDMLRSPVLWAVAAGVLLGATGLYGKLGQWGIAGLLDSGTDFLSAPTGMIILLTVGYDLVPKQIPWKQTVRLIAVRLVSMAVCLCVLIGVNRTVLPGQIFEGAAVLMMILPPPYVLPVFADAPGERVQTASALSALTVVCLVLFAGLAIAVGAK